MFYRENTSLGFIFFPPVSSGIAGNSKSEDMPSPTFVFRITFLFYRKGKKGSGENDNSLLTPLKENVDSYFVWSIWKSKNPTLEGQVLVTP